MEPVVGVDEVAILQGLLSAHRSMVLGALNAGADVDVDGAFMIHAALARLLARWDEFSADEQREIVGTIEYVINSDDDIPDLESADGFADDWEKVRSLQAFLGYSES
jgi:hypothetical protein